ncbi:MAG: glycosyltransferase family protein [Methanobacteriota archaeon]
MEIIYGICSWGLGHATRSLPVLRKLVSEQQQVTVISNGRALELLQKELGDSVQYEDVPDYPMLLSENTRQFMAKSMLYWPVFIKRIEDGLRSLGEILSTKDYDLIVSDGRYDMYSKKIPSFFISHQMRIMNPLRIRMFENAMEWFNLFFFKRFRGVIIPDYRTDDLSGDLSHNLKRIDEDKLHYVGALSDFTKKNLKKDIDFFLSLSGPEPQRSMLQERLLGQLHELQGTIIVTLGKTEKPFEVTKKKNITTYSFLPKEKREELLNRAKLVISRSGYSTILDLAVIGTKALMIPTPGQIEQEYLARYHTKKGTFYTVHQQHVDLHNDIVHAQKTTGITRQCSVQKTVDHILDIIMST